MSTGIPSSGPSNGRLSQTSSRFSGTGHATPASSLPPILAQVRFGKKNEAGNSSDSGGSKDVRNGLKEACKAIFNKNGLIDDTAWVGALSLLLFFIPGHQILSIPIIFGIGAAMRAIGGYISGINHRPYQPSSIALDLLKKMGIGGKKENRDSNSAE